MIDSGVDLDRFRGRDATEARRTARLGGRGAVLSLSLDGSTSERTSSAWPRPSSALGRGSLAFVGDGPLRAALEGRPGVRLVGRVPHDEVATWISACDVLCQPSLVEPFGQALLEAMASERSVVATEVGGPPEFVTAEAGVLVDPLSVEAIADGLRRAGGASPAESRRARGRFGARRPAPGRARRSGAEAGGGTR